MGRSIVSTDKLTKQSILNKIDQISIFSAYLNLPVETIKWCISTGGLICSPVRKDVHPTCGFKYTDKGKLYFKDFAGFLEGDVFDIVAFVMTNMYNTAYNVLNKNDFIKILRHISFTFKDIFYGGKKDSELINNIHVNIENIKTKKTNIELVIRDWNDDDKKYWQQFGVDLKYLNINFTYPVEQYYIDRTQNETPRYYYQSYDPCYAYILGMNKYGFYDIKLYFPNRPHKHIRFITNCNHLEGIYNLNESNYNIIILTKSSKDRLSLGNYLLNNPVKPLKIGVINIPCETYKLRQFEYDWLCEKLAGNGRIVSLMDNDRTGKQEALWLRQTYNICPLLIPNKYKAKDFAELYSMHSKTVMNQIIKETRWKLLEEE